MADFLSVRGLTIDAATERGTAHILRHVDLDLARGRILGIVGESGSGKSTLASALIGLLASNITSITGEIRFDGVDLLTLPRQRINEYRGRRIAMIFQDPMTALNPLFTVGTHLVDVLRRRDARLSRGEALKRAGELLRRVGIADPDERLAAYPHQLSGGMRQRVMIAMALGVEPDLLLADEPTTALDATIEAQIVDLFDKLRRDFSGSVIFISHHLGLVAQLCDEICVMYAGTVVERGPVDAVVGEPKHPYTKALLDCDIEDDHDGELVSIPGEVPDPLAETRACVFAPRCAFATDRCRSVVPELREIRAGQFAACIRVEEIGL